MSRRPRIEVADVPYHLIVRGNNREAIFLDRGCYDRYLNILEGYRLVHGYKLYCYCLMPNHIHLILEPSLKASISKIMQCINTSYTLYLNKKYNRTGHVLAGRYKSKIIDDNEYLLHLSRYIHLNPVEAGLSETPYSYRYSSIRYYLQKGIKDGPVDANFILSCLSPDVLTAIYEYKIFLDDTETKNLTDNSIST